MQLIAPLGDYEAIYIFQEISYNMKPGSKFISPSGLELLCQNARQFGVLAGQTNWPLPSCSWSLHFLLFIKIA